MAQSKQNSFDSLQETTGALPETQEKTESVASVTATAQKQTTVRPDTTDMHQTHGAMPITGPIMSVADLVRGGAAKGSVESFSDLGSYSKYLNTLTLGDLHRHAVEEARIVPIDDRNRLIHRLEGEYSAIASKNPRRFKPVAQPKPYSQQQMDTLEDLRHKTLQGLRG